MSRCGSTAVSVRVSFPRVSGDEPQVALDVNKAFMFSPRERG